MRRVLDVTGSARAIRDGSTKAIRWESSRGFASCALRVAVRRVSAVDVGACDVRRRSLSAHGRFHARERAWTSTRGFAGSAVVERRGAEDVDVDDVRVIHSRVNARALVNVQCDHNGWRGRGIRDTNATHIALRYARGFAAEPVKQEDESEETIQVDLRALDKARAEIDKLHRERQLKSWQRAYASAVGGVAYVASYGPWVLSFGKMSKVEWRAATKKGWAHAKEEAHHYWSGAKLLWVEVKIASRLSWRLMSGSDLSRRERRQLTRTTADVFRLVPFAAFVLIPFMELLLPVALKIFPNMLPTTFRDELKYEEELKKKLKAKLEVARFLQDTVRMMAKGLKHSRNGVTRERADELYVFMKKIRTGMEVTNEDITKFSKIFNDEFTLHQINRAQLVNMCKFVGIAPYGTDTFLRFQLRTKLRDLKNDDKTIYFEGLTNMTTSELRSAARARGMRWECERDELITQLEDWLDLSLKQKLPPTLLLLSRAFAITATSADSMVDNKSKVLEDITVTLASLPEDAVDSVAVDEGLATQTAANREDYTKRMEFVEREEEIIEEEREAAAAQEEKKSPEPETLDVASAEMTDVTTAKAKPIPPPADGDDADAESLRQSEQAIKDEEKKTYAQEQRAKRTAQLSRLLTMVSDASSVSVERAELMMLVKKGVEAYSDRVEAARCAPEQIAVDQEAIDAIKAQQDNEEARLSNELADQVSKRVDKLLQSACNDIEEAERRIGDKLRVLDTDCDGTITMAELMKVRDVLGSDQISESDEIDLVNILSSLIRSDGTIAVNDLRKLTSEVIEKDHLEDIEEEDEVANESAVAQESESIADQTSVDSPVDVPSKK